MVNPEREVDKIKTLPESMVEIYNYMEKHGEGRNMVVNLKNQIWHVWRGYASELAKHVDCSTATVNRHISTLTTLGCIEKIKQGSGTTPTLYRIIKQPAQTEYISLIDRSLLSNRLDIPSQAMRLRDDIIRLGNRVSKLEKDVARLREGNR